MITFLLKPPLKNLVSIIILTNYNFLNSSWIIPKFVKNAYTHSFFFFVLLLCLCLWLMLFGSAWLHTLRHQEKKSRERKPSQQKKNILSDRSAGKFVRKVFLSLASLFCDILMRCCRFLHLFAERLWLVEAESNREGLRSHRFGERQFGW